MTYRNQCAALAWGDNFYSVRRGLDKAMEKANALKICNEKTKNCQIYHSDCSYPERVQ